MSSASPGTNGQPVSPADTAAEMYKDLEEKYQDLLADQGRLKKQNEQLQEQCEQLEDRVLSLVARLMQYGEDPTDLMETAAGQPEERGGPLVDDNPLEGCEPIEDRVFDLLPDLLAEPCDFWSRRHKRDVFLTSALGVLSGCMPSLHGYWGSDVPTPHGPNLYTAFVAGAAGGKSAGDAARTLGRDVHRRIEERSEQKRENWQERKDAADRRDEEFNEPEPPKRYLWTPANTSYSHLLHTLDNQDGRGVIYSSEIDTVADALGQDWGAFDSLLRKAYHHEADDQGRRKSGTIRIEDPCVSLVLGGTDEQFVSLVGSAENGLYSRLCLYYFDAADRYRSQRPSREGIERTERLEALADEVGELWAALDGRSSPLRFEFREHHWKSLDESLQPLHRNVQALGFSHLLSIPRRAGVWAWRISMVLTALQAWADGIGLRRLDTLEATDESVDAAIPIAKTYADHALRFARAKLEDAEKRSPKDRRIAAILSGVEERFSTSDAYVAASEFDVSERTLRRDLSAAERRGLIRRLNDGGAWEKL